MKVDIHGVCVSAVRRSVQLFPLQLLHVVKGSFLHHLWYLCPELVVLAMFDSEKAAMARALLQHPVPDAFAPGKPGGRHFEQITPKLADFIAARAQAPCLSTFITDWSWLFFHLAGRNSEEWLQRAPEEWPQNPDYTFMSEVASDMLVVNDCAERTKAITD